MAKNIVLLSDGTGNAAAKVWKTNVWRVYQALDLTTPNQLAYYDDGVGTSSFKPLAIIGGALGFGLKRNVLSIYSFLCRHYRPGDRIYGFGFSRGAYTMRVVAALVAREGVVPYNGDEAELRRNVKAAYREYRYRYGSKNYLWGWVFNLARGIRDAAIASRNKMRGFTSYRSLKKAPPPKIEFLGLWDTVDAYGLPVDEMTRAIHLFYFPLELPDRKLHPGIKRACHALALDDERTTFHPVLWDEDETTKKRLTQIWFTGMHANVGGGYPDDGIAYVSLSWIMDEAGKAGLSFRKNPKIKDDLASAADLNGRLYDSRHGFASYYRYGPRRIDYLCNDNFQGVTISAPKIHESALARIKAKTKGYAPIGLPEKYQLVSLDGKPVQRNSYENARLAQWRAQAQERVWDWVWLKRGFYFANLAATLHLAAFPFLCNKIACPKGGPVIDWLRGTTVTDWLRKNSLLDWYTNSSFAKTFGGFPDNFRVLVECINSFYASLFSPLAKLPYADKLQYAWSETTKLVKPAMDFVSNFLPGFLQGWLEAFGAFPAQFLRALAVVIVLTLISTALQRRIFAGMRWNWAPMINGKSSPPPPVRLTLLSRFRLSRLYKVTHLLIRKFVLPAAFALLYLFLIVWLFLKIWIELAH